MKNKKSEPSFDKHGFLTSAISYGMTQGISPDHLGVMMIDLHLALEAGAGDAGYQI